MMPLSLVFIAPEGIGLFSRLLCFVCVFTHSFFALVAQAAELQVLAIPGSFGVQTHVERLSEVELEKHIQLIKRAGFCWTRTDLIWELVEHKKGIYDFSRYDKVIDAFERAGIRILVTLGFSNSNYEEGLAPISMEARLAFGRFAEAAAKRYSKNNIVWEIYNEPNLKEFWKPEPNVSQYIDLSNEATEAIRRADPTAAIVGPALGGPYSENGLDFEKGGGKDFISRVLSSKAAHSWNAITVHPYQLKSEGPETSKRQLDTIRSLMTEHGIDPRQVPLIASEWGYHTSIYGVDEQTQAALVVRTLLWGIIEKMPFSIIYDWQDDGTHPWNSEHRFGIVRYGGLNGDLYQRKPAFRAIELLSRLLGGYIFEKKIEADDAVMIAQFDKDGQKAIAIWSTDGNKHTTTLMLSQENWQSTSLMDYIPVALHPQAGQATTVEAGSIPVLIWNSGTDAGK